MTLNKATLIGRLGRDPEVRRTGSGDPVVTVSLATSETWKDKATGERKERTEWHTIVIFNEHLGRIVEQYAKKGSEIYVEGQIQTRKYTDKDNIERYRTEIVLGRFDGEVKLLARAPERTAPDRDSYGTTSTRDSSYAAARNGSAQSGGAGGSRGHADLEDDVPF